MLQPDFVRLLPPAAEQRKPHDVVFGGLTLSATYERLEAPGLQVAGATMPGLPGVVLGQNADIAWGYTNTAPDVQDVYIERISPDDPARYHRQIRREVDRLRENLQEVVPANELIGKSPPPALACDAATPLKSFL